MALIAGVNPKAISERLGHSSIVTTMAVYSHVLPGLQEEAKAVENVLSQARRKRLGMSELWYYVHEIHGIGLNQTNHTRCFRYESAGGVDRKTLLLHQAYNLKSATAKGV